MRVLALVLLLVGPAVQEKKASDADKKAAKQKLEQGMALLAKGNTEGGINTLEEAVKLDSGQVKAHEALARAYFAQNNRKALEHVWDLAVIGGPLSPEMQKILNAQQSVVLCGVRWLVRHQAADGRWSGDGFGSTCRGGAKCDGKGEAGREVQATALGLLALMGAGFATPSRETFDQKHLGTVSKNALTWLQKQQKPDGGIGDPSGARSLEDHALATLALVEAYGLTQVELLKDPAQKSLDYLEAHRMPEKGWGAKPKAESVDPTTTGWALFSLRSARLSGLKTPEGTMPGEFRTIYDASLFGPALAAASGKPELLKDLAPVIQKITAEEVSEDPKARDMLKIFLSEVILHRGDPDGPWKAWRDSARNRLAKSERFDGNGDACVAGSWDPVGPADAGRGRLIMTAFTVLAFEVEYRFKNHFCAAPPPEK